MVRKRGFVALGVVAVVAAGGGAALAGGADDDNARERPITGSALDRASRVALDHVGEGRVTGTEVGDEESRYEVEVTKDDGSEVDVQLSEAFSVVGAEAERRDDGDDGP